MSVFQLQQFVIDQSLSGMKVCSDSLLFGALIPVKGVKQILDIGTGTGLLSLMQAQKSSGLIEQTLERITAVEITAEGAQEAEKNFRHSPWHTLLKIIHQDIQSFSQQALLDSNKKYDLIICNPPFFSQQSPTDSSNSLRHTARHTAHLTYDDLCHSIACLLAETGSAYLLLPVFVKDEFTRSLANEGLRIIEMIEISESKKHAAKVMVIAVSFSLKKCETVRTLYKFDSPNVHTSAVKEYLAPFLLRYKGSQ